MPYYPKENNTKSLRELRLYWVCSECGSRLDAVYDLDKHQPYLVCKEDKAHEGIAKKYQEPKEKNIETRRSEMAVKTRAQISMDDRRVDNTELEGLLENRQELKEGAAEYKQADKKAKKMIETLNEPLPYRIGRFIIAEAVIPAKSVSFDTDAGKRITIKTADE